MTNPAVSAPNATRNPSDTKYSGEVEMVGLYAGGIFGGFVFGVAGDILNSEINTMAWYAGGVLLGGLAGLIAATIFRRLA